MPLIKQPRMGLFDSIANHDEALEIAKSCGQQLLFFAAVQAAVVLYHGHYLGLFDAALLAGCGYFIREKQSRAAAGIAITDSILVTAASLRNALGYSSGGANFLIAACVVWVAIRAFQATSKLRALSKTPATPLNGADS